MDKTKYFMNIAMGISFCIVFATGLLKMGLLKYLGANTAVLPWRTISLWHDWSGVVMGAFITAHILMHLSSFKIREESPKK